MNKSSVAICLIIVFSLFGCTGINKPDKNLIDKRSEVVMGPGFCSSSADCPHGQICLFNHCITDTGGSSVCFSDRDCRWGEICVAKRCMPNSINPDDDVPPQCRTSIDCPSYMYCSFPNHVCKLKSGRCVNATNCPLGYICNRTNYCEKGSNYCEKDSDCPYGKECSGRRSCGCFPVCQMQGATKCENRTVYRCLGRHGCLKWSREETCDMGERCVGGRCIPCNNKCDREGQKKKSCPDGSFFERRSTCLKDKDGCLDWYSIWIPCGGNGQFSACKNGKCWP